MSGIVAREERKLIAFLGLEDRIAVLFQLPIDSLGQRAHGLLRPFEPLGNRPARLVELHAAAHFVIGDFLLRHALGLGALHRSSLALLEIARHTLSFRWLLATLSSFGLGACPLYLPLIDGSIEDRFSFLRSILSLHVREYLLPLLGSGHPATSGA